MAPYHILIVIISSVIPENLVLLTKSEQSSLKSAHIHPTGRSMRMLLFLPYDRSDQTFYNQTGHFSKHQKLLLQDASLGKSLNRQGSVNQKENSCKSSA